MRAFPIYGSGLLAVSVGSLTALANGASVGKAPANEERGDVAVVNVRGPLVHHVDAEFDSYDAIKARVDAALQSSARAVVLRIDSPGGLVSGCFDTARELRRMAARAGRRLIAYAEQATSASYALACACSEIYASSTATVGSIGVIDTVLDVTALDQAQGVKLAVVTSGARKADSNPHTPLDDSKVSASQANVDTVARLFFELVADARGLDASAVEGLQAATFPGVLATGHGLVDHVATIEECLEAVARAPLTFSDVRRALSVAVASEPNPTTRARLQRALLEMSR